MRYSKMASLKYGTVNSYSQIRYSKKASLKKIHILVFKTNYRLMQDKSKGSILQFFWPSLSYHVIKIVVLPILERLFYKGFTVWHIFLSNLHEQVLLSKLFEHKIVIIFWAISLNMFCVLKFRQFVWVSTA